VERKGVWVAGWQTSWGGMPTREIGGRKRGTSKQERDRPSKSEKREFLDNVDGNLIQKRNGHRKRGTGEPKGTDRLGQGGRCLPEQVRR